MIDIDRDRGMQNFQVRVGHHTFLVRSHSRQDAIVQSRRLLRDDLPQMWDVIESLGDDRFHVTADAAPVGGRWVG